MCEHLTERVSERMKNAQNQPSQRGYILGCHQRGTQGVGKNGYSVQTLMGNWNEEQADGKFSANRALVVGDEEHRFNANRTSVVASKNRIGGIREGHECRDTQPNMVQVVNKERTIFPGHQPGAGKNSEFYKEHFVTEKSGQFTDPATRDDKPRSKGQGRGLSPNDREMVLIQHVRRVILEQGGSTGFRGIRHILTRFDINKNGKLSNDEVREGLEMYGLRLSDEEAQIVFEHFDRNRSGQVDLDEFIAGVRGPMNDRRLKLTTTAYGLLDKNFDGVVTLSDIKMAYDASQHPAVLMGTKNEEDVLAEFMHTWDEDDDGLITLDEFVSYYNDLSAGITNEQYFELMIRNAWHMSGGRGAAENTSCRRVLVTHKNGTQTVEEIKNDLGIGPNDTDKMLANLAAQGIQDVAKIETQF
eukprot:TRINITY_DN21312_c0_g1_i1.p1 TRINITY_DN21312_c0_g1~~TRINITY_DN21312_c0_g1_i1.p1  ORF type:complete len:415 (+),score=158.73 TRINITY_DN21312_c0_g1_i1:72-1316(+)